MNLPNDHDRIGTDKVDCLDALLLETRGEVQEVSNSSGPRSPTVRQR